MGVPPNPIHGWPCFWLPFANILHPKNTTINIVISMFVYHMFIYNMDPNTVWEGTANPLNHPRSHFRRRYDWIGIQYQCFLSQKTKTSPALGPHLPPSSAPGLAHCWPGAWPSSWVPAWSTARWAPSPGHPRVSRLVNSLFTMANPRKSTNYMAIFKSEVLVCQRVHWETV